MKIKFVAVGFLSFLIKICWEKKWEITNSILKQNNLLSLYHNHVWHSVDCSKIWSPNQHNEKSKRIAADQIAEKNTSHALKMNYVSVTFKIPISSLVSNEVRWCELALQMNNFEM